MLKKNAQLFEALLTASDLLVVSLAWIASYWIRFQTDWIPIEKGIPLFSDYLKVLIFVWVVWAFVFRRFALYRPMRGSNRLREIWLLVKANSFAVLLFLALTYLFREKSVPFSRAVFLIFWILSTAATVGSRSFIRQMLRYMRRRGYNLRYALVVGAGSLAETVVHRIRKHPEYGIKVLGCLASGDDAKNGDSAKNRLRIAGTYADLPALLDDERVDQVIVALPLADHLKVESVLESIGDAMVDVKIVPDFHQFIQLGSLVEEFDGLAVMTVASTPLAGFSRFQKRVLDILLGTVFLILALPVMGLAALLVKLSSRGPIFYAQERVGLDGRVFKIYKFRTMRLDAEANGAQFAVEGDPRVTTIGRIMRRLSIDELPQLFNVVRGHMSLVGPRPERPVFISEFRRRIPKYMLRHKVQAGMTGWAQVNGWRGNTSIERRIEHDLFYIENWSLAFDLKILGMTIWRGVINRNAY